MNNSFSRLIDGMCATLRGEVIPRLDDDFARGQVYGVIYLLNTFKARGDWSLGFLAQQIGAQRAAFARISTMVEDTASAATMPAVPSSEPPAIVTARELEVVRDDGNRTIGALLAWLAAEREAMPAALAQSIEQELKLCMRAEVDIELKNAARPMFAEMSSGREG